MSEFKIDDKNNLNRFRSWDENGNKLIYFYNKNCNFHGTYRRWHGERILEESCYLNGELHGRRIMWHSNGKLKLYSYYQRGLLHGRFRQWYFTGKIQIDCYYKNDKLHGMHKEYVNEFVNRHMYRDGILVS